MDRLFAVDWRELFVPTHSLAEMVVRGTLMYVALFLILRFAMKRQSGSIGIADILVIVVIADAAQNGFARDYQSISEGLVLVLTIVFWDFAIDWLAWRYPGLGRILESKPVPLIRDGRMLRRNMRREYISVDELEANLRKAGVDNIGEVKSAHMESDGEISVVKRAAFGGKGRASKPKGR